MCVRMLVQLPHNGWQPRDDQKALWSYLRAGGLHAVEIAHRRWGKDDVALHHTAMSMVERVGTYWHMLPEAAQARKAIWTAVNAKTGKRRIDEAFPDILRENVNEGEMFIRLKNGSTWQAVGSDNYNSLVGSNPAGIIHSEYALADPAAAGYFSPILAENRGWELYITTPRGNNHAKRILDYARVTYGWFGQILKATDTPVFTPYQLAQEKEKLIAMYGEDHGLAKFAQEFLCSFEGAVFGAYYSKQLVKAREEGRICNVPVSPGHEVYTFWDLGVDDSTSIWFMQFPGKEIRVIDYYENTGMGMAHYAGVLKGKGYHYGDHYMPHDADYREMGGGEYAKTPKEIAEDLGIKPVNVVQRARDTQTVIAHINMARNTFDSCWFDEKRCMKGLSGLEAYCADYDEKKKKLDNKPLHNWASHPSDAWRTFAVGWTGRGRYQTRKKERPSSKAFY